MIQLVQQLLSLIVLGRSNIINLSPPDRGDRFQENNKLTMKKILFAILCIGTLASCAREEVTTSHQVEIKFANAFVDVHGVRTKAADPTVTSNSIDAFKVWGFMDQTSGWMFDGKVVSRDGDAWTYEDLQYWTPEHTYYFGALAPVENCSWTLSTDNANEYGIGVVSFTNVDGTEDLLYAATKVTTADEETLLAEGMDPVNLTFSHLLSKVKFTFTNAFTTENVTMTVSEIKMTVPKAATIDLAVENWWDNDDWTVTGTETTTLDFANVPGVLEITQSAASTNQRLTFPAAKTATYEISFKVNLTVGDQPAMEIEKTATLTGVAFNMGRSYNIKADITPENLGLLPIEFSVEVNEWIPENPFELTLN